MIKRSIFQFCAHPLRSMEFVNLHILNPKVLHENQRIDVNPIPGALVINLGEVLQLISNDRFISVQHRVLSKNWSSKNCSGELFKTTTSSSRE